VATSGQDLRNGGHVEQSVQANSGVAIVMEHPTGSKAVENIVRTPGGQLPLAFTDNWNEDRMPRAADMDGPHGAAKDGPRILTALMVSSGGRQHNQHRGHCTGRIPG
jgi:hypothetical protein